MIAADLASLAVPVDSLELLPGNPRQGDVPAVAASLAAFGQRKPIVVRRSDRTVVAGNHTLQAAQELGWEEIAVVWVDDDDATAKAFALADNRTAELGGYDERALAALIGEVQATDLELLAATGWSETDLAELLAGLESDVPPGDEDDGADDLPPPGPAVTVPGDIWQLGPHRLMCGDSRVPTDVDALMAGEVVHVAFTSPPYAEQRVYDESSGFRPIPPDEYVEWFSAVAANVAAHLAPDGSWFVNIKEHCDEGQRVLYVKDLTLAHVRSWGWRFVDELCWDRMGGVPGRWANRFKNSWEPVFHYCRQPQIKFDPVAVGHPSDDVVHYSPDNPKTHSGFLSGSVGNNGGRHSGIALPSNVVRVGNAKADPERGHTAEFPVALPGFFIKAHSQAGDHVFDPFMGSGSTLIAAHDTGRRAFGMEISPGYVDVICRRYQQHTGDKPVAEATGEPKDFFADG